MMVVNDEWHPSYVNDLQINVIHLAPDNES